MAVHGPTKMLIQAFVFSAVFVALSVSVPVGDRQLADSLTWSVATVEDDLGAILKYRLQRYFDTDSLARCVREKENAILEETLSPITKVLTDLDLETATDQETVMTLLQMQDVLEGNVRMVIDSTEDVSSLLVFRSRLRDILSMSLGSPGPDRFAEMAGRVVARLSTAAKLTFSKVSTGPVRMLDLFLQFASAQQCAANIRLNE